MKGNCGTDTEKQVTLSTKQIFPYLFQAFCLPIIQIVHETLADIKEGKGSKIQSKSSSGGENDPFLSQLPFLYLILCSTTQIWMHFKKFSTGYLFVGTKWKMSMFDRTDAMGMYR